MAPQLPPITFSRCCMCSPAPCLSHSWAVSRVCSRPRSPTP
jgi:hypothetical protein